MATDQSRSNLPPPEKADDIQRVEHTRLRRRLLYDCHDQDLHDLLRADLGHVRSSAWGKPDLTANPFQSLWNQVAMLYSEEPQVIAPEGAELLAETISETGLWPMMQRVQRDTLALREMLVRVDVHEDGTLSYRPVFPDMVTAESHPRTPGTPVVIREALEDPIFGWVWHETSIKDANHPHYRVYTPNGENVTEPVLGQSFDGEAYPYRDSQGKPHLNYVLYHASETGFLFDAYTMRGVVEGSLNIGELLTFYRHIVRNAAWAQRYTVGAEPIGLEVEGSDPQANRREVVSDPATLLVLKPMQDVGQASVGQWSVPADPESILRSVSMYERRILLLAGMQPPDVTRQEADIRSGYSLAVARESIREAQRIYEPQFRKGDLRLLSLSAILLNRATGSNYPENGWRIRYRAIPRSPAELQAQRDQLVGLIEANLLDKVSAYRELHPELSREEAEIALTEIASINARHAL